MKEETNLVTIQLKEYNRLRDFHNEYKGKIFHTVSKTYSCCTEKLYYQENDALDMLMETNKKLNIELKNLKHSLYMDKKMTIWQFIKWRRNNN